MRADLFVPHRQIKLGRRCPDSLLEKTTPGPKCFPARTLIGVRGQMVWRRHTANTTGTTGRLPPDLRAGRAHQGRGVRIDRARWRPAAGRRGDGTRHAATAEQSFRVQPRLIPFFSGWSPATRLRHRMDATWSSSGAPHRGGGLPPSEPELVAESHDRATKLTVCARLIKHSRAWSRDCPK